MLIRPKIIIIAVFFTNVCLAQSKINDLSQAPKSKPLAGCNDWLYLSAQPSYMSVGDLDVTGNQITVEAVFNRTTPYVGGYLYAGDLVSKHTGPVNVNYLLRPSDAEITTDDGVYHITPPVCDIQLNKTYHVAMVYDGAILKFYRNGVLLSQTPVTGNLFQNDINTEIGYYQAQTYNENFIGYINEVKIWNVARTQAQIQANMNGPLPSPSTQTGLLAYYQFSSLTNQQGNAAWDGTLSGAASINQTNPMCPFVLDNDCCPIITGSLSGNSTCSDGIGQLTFHPTTGLSNPPYTLVYNYLGTSFTQSNVSDNIPFPVSFQPSGLNQYTLLKITDGALCSTDVSGPTATITVLKPAKLTVTPNSSICENGNIQLNVTGGTAFVWTPGAGLNDPNIPNPTATPAAPTMYYVSGRDPNNCLSKDSVKIDFLPKPIFIAPSGKSTCAGDPVTLDGGNGTTNHYSWSPSAFLDNPSSAYPVANLNQTTVFNVLVSDPVCPLYDSGFTVKVQVNPAPKVSASKTNDIDCASPTTVLTAAGAETYSWSPALLVDHPDNPVVKASPAQTTSFIVQGRDANGCSSSDSVSVVVTKTGETTFSVPNAFTPNNDHINDCFGIKSWGNVNLQQFSIYNRWGQKVFESKDPSACWDGTFQGEKQPAGGYVYIIRASSFCSENIMKKGTVLLIR